MEGHRDTHTLVLYVPLVSFVFLYIFDALLCIFSNVFHSQNAKTIHFLESYRLINLDIIQLSHNIFDSVIR